MVAYDKIYNLRRIAQAFREAINTAKTNREPYGFFQNFPCGQCGHTSEMLAKYLSSKGYTHIIYETGVYYWDDFEWNEDHVPNQHTWLLVDGIVIDITGDQFEYYDEPLKNNIPVYVGPKTMYYELFDVHPYGRYETKGYHPNDPMGKDLDIWYHIVLKYLSTNI